MKTICTTLLTAGLAGALLMSLAPSAPTALGSPPVGPGGVIDAVQAFTHALQRGDVEQMRGAMIDHEAYQGAPGFHDIGLDGRVVEADTMAEFIRAWGAAAHRSGDVELEQDITRIVSDCPSGDVAYAYVEFDRTSPGAKGQRVPMRATALLKHVKGRPWFKIFHWNVSRADDGPGVKLGKLEQPVGTR